MRREILIVLLASWIAGCQWSPERDNPYDPYSIGFAGNSPPRIDSFYVTTHFYENDLGSISKYRLICLVSDEDNNFPASPKFPIFREDTIFQGYLNSDPIQQVFLYEGFQDDLPDLFVHKFTVHVADDLGLDTVKANASITNWNTGIRARLVSPEQQADPPERFFGPDPPRIVWRKPGSGDYSHYGLTLRLQNIYLRWDTVGISLNDTVAYVPLDKVKDSRFVPGAWYAIYLTLYDNYGNSSTAVPGFFQYFGSDSQIDESYLREEYEY